MSKISIIIPAYNEEENIRQTASVISTLMIKESIPFEILFVDDGSKDRTWEEISSCAEIDERIHGVSFSRNFGKEAAIFAGLAKASGDCCVVIDCDLQHPPEKIVSMYRLWEEGYEIVEGVKSNRGHESVAHGFAAKSFYKIISRTSGIDMENASDFKLLDRRAVEALLTFSERNTFFRALSGWIGFKTCSIEYDVRERAAGTSKWSTSALIQYALSNITSFSAAPMQIITTLGSVLFVLSVIMAIVALVQKIAGVALGGFTTVIILQCFTGSVVMISLGIIGYYIAKIYEEVKGRPRYIIGRETRTEKTSDSGNK